MLDALKQYAQDAVDFCTDPKVEAVAGTTLAVAGYVTLGIASGVAMAKAVGTTTVVVGSIALVAGVGLVLHAASEHASRPADAEVEVGSGSVAE